MSASLMSLVWFVAVLVLIPLALLMLKRGGLATGFTARAPAGAPRVVANLPLGTQQRIVTVEVGEGDARRWLVLGVSGQGIQALHTLAEPPVVPEAKPMEVPPFAQVLGRLLNRNAAGSSHAR